MSSTPITEEVVAFLLLHDYLAKTDCWPQLSGRNVREWTKALAAMPDECARGDCSHWRFKCSCGFVSAANIPAKRLHAAYVDHLKAVTA